MQCGRVAPERGCCVTERERRGTGRQFQTDGGVPPAAFVRSLILRQQRGARAHAQRGDQHARANAFSHADPAMQAIAVQ